MKFNRTALQVCLLLGHLFLPLGVAAQSCNPSILTTSPDAGFIIHNVGTATHKATGLIWMRCSLGQTWDGKTCRGEAVAYPWGIALQKAEESEFAGNNDWRVPNKNEMETIFEEACRSPAINNRVFPATPAAFFWSSSPYAGKANGAWSLDFGYGSVNASVKNGSLHVRLVRGGR
jgi:hypothetical protein